jgi:ubiquinone/menaquinone biosynthesis C-methylase UbiE
MRAPRTAASWVARVVLALVFLGSGAFKLSANPEAVASFETLGLGQAARVLVGLAEVLGAFGLLITPLATPAATGLAALMVGAVASHLLVLGPSAVPATVCLLLCLFVAWQERSAFAALRLISTGKGPMDGWIARHYDGGVQTAFRDLMPELSADVLPNFAGAARILDAGCGPGQFTIYFAEQVPGAQVWGIDLAPTMIELAGEHAGASAASSRLRFDVADVAALPFDDDFFDAVVSTGSIKHWPDAVAGLREIHRVLRPGGTALIAEMNRLAPPAAIEAQRVRLRHWFFRLVYPRVFSKGLSPDEARGVFGSSPFGEPATERLLLGGCLWLFEVRKAGATGA